MAKAPPKTKSASAGYSGKSLIDKLGFKPGSAAVAIHAPANYAELVEGAAIKPVASLPKTGAFDFIHAFVSDTAELKTLAPKLDARLAEGGMVWISWPKKTSPLFRDLTEDGVRAIILPLPSASGRSLVDVKVCAVDADWSGLKLLRRKV